MHLTAGVLSRIMSSPTGAEVSGPSFQWSGGRGYLACTMQHLQDFSGNKVPRDGPEVRHTDQDQVLHQPLLLGQLQFVAGGCL